MTKEIDYVELLKLAHEKLGSQSDMIAELEGKIFKQSQESKEEVSRAIEIILEKDDKIAELEREKETLTQHHGMWKDQWHELNNRLPIRDLEQQAKGVNDVCATTGFWNLSTCSLRTHLREYEIILINQAKALKEQE
jgi:hypothetical protein